MKHFAKKIGILIVVAQVVFSSTNALVFAQTVNFDSFNDTTWDNPAPTTDSNGGIIWDPNYNPYTPVDYNQFNNTTFTNPGTYTGTYTTNTDNTGVTWDPNYNPYTPVDYNQFNNTTFTNGGTYTGTQSCIGCNTPTISYVDPTLPVTYSNSSSLNLGYSTNGWSTNGGYYNGGYYAPPVTQIICPAGSNLINGQCINTVNGTIITTISCPSGTVVNGSTCVNTVNGTVVTNIVCPSGMTLSGNQCINTVNGNVVTNIVCPAGSTLTGNQCVNTVNGNVVTNTICPSGTTLTNGQCINTVTPPVTTVTNCPSNTVYTNGVCQQIVNPPVVVMQTCWNGAVIPATQTCAPQYKVCANGTSVPVNQNCYVIPSQPGYIPPQIVKFNNVVTSIATQITNTSGRCNGIGLIANNAQSTGWFEYGDSPSLGRTTASATIGSAPTAPFSNVLANLKPSTRYYCRAVMQNQYGIVKGEIVSFITARTATSYVAPVTPVKKAVTPIKKVTPVKKNEVTCSDGTTIKVSNESASSMINKGEKLVALQIEKVDGNLSAGSQVKYKISYKNLVDTRLTGFMVKVTLPQELAFTSTNAGTYDEVTRTITLNQDTLDSYTEGIILVTATVVKEASLGKTIVTNVYAVYTVPGTRTQDEVTAYVIGSIVPSVDTTNKDTGAKKVVGLNSEKGFMPNSLIEWLALLAILFIIFILGRSIYASYKEEGTGGH